MLKHCKASCGKCPDSSDDESFQKDQASGSTLVMGCKVNDILTYAARANPIYCFSSASWSWFQGSQKIKNSY